MSKPTIWTEERVSKLRADVNALVAKGSTKKAAYEKLGSKWKIGPLFMADLCTIGVEGIRAARKRYYMKHRQSGTRVIGSTNRTAVNVTTGTTMTAEEAIQFYNFLKRMNITIA